MLYSQLLSFEYFEHLEVDNKGGKEDANGLDEVAEHMDEGRRDIDVFTWEKC